MKLPILSKAAVQPLHLQGQILPCLLRQATSRTTSVPTIAQAAGVQTRQIARFVVLLMYITRPTMPSNHKPHQRQRLHRPCLHLPPSRRKTLPAFGTIPVLKVVQVDPVMQVLALHAVVRWHTMQHTTIELIPQPLELWEAVP